MKYLVFSLISLVTFAFYGCGTNEKEKVVYVDREVIVEVPVEKEVSSDQGNDDSANNNNNGGDNGGEDGAALTEVNLQGSLAVSGAGALAIGLVNAPPVFSLVNDSTHTIYCTTFEDEPVACSAAVGSDGKFNSKCKGYAGKTFGCFLRKGSKTLTTIEFSGESSMVAGAGNLVSNITYDEETGLARAKIDQEQSSALSADAIAAALKSTGLKQTTLASMTGTWDVECVNDDTKGISCDTQVVTAVDTTKNFCAKDYYGNTIYIQCAEQGTGVDVPEGYCYDQWYYWDEVNMKSLPAYYDCSSMYAYCEEPAMAMMPECMEMKAKEPVTAPEKIYFSEFTDGDDKRKAALWESKARRDMCVHSGATEAKPAFGLRVGDGSGDFYFFDFNLSTRSSLDGSIDQAVVDMIQHSDSHVQFLAKKILSMSKSRESWRIDQCDNSPYGDTDNTGESCKFRLEEIETYTWEEWDPNTGEYKTVTQNSPIWWYDINDFDSNTNDWKTDVSGDGYSSEVVQCTFDAADGSGLPFCPPYASSAGKYTQYFKTDANGNKLRLMLVCKVTQSYGDSNSYSWLQQSAAPSDTLTGSGGAIDLMADASGCGAPYSSGPLANIPEIQLESMRRVALEFSLSRNYQFDKDYLCHGVDTEDSWNFNQCDSIGYGEAGYQLCWETWNFSSQLGLSKSNTTGTFFQGCTNPTDLTQTDCENNAGQWNYNTQTTSISNWDAFFYESCANLDGTVKTAFDTWAADSSNQTNIDGLVNACRDFLTTGGSNAINLDRQKALMKQVAMRYEWMPAKALACSAPSTAAQTKILAGIENSCMADASLNMFCDYNGNCMSSLRCNGSGEGGKCYKDGEFIGLIPGRLGSMDVKLRTSGAFELSETVQDRWTQWSTTENKEETCDATRTIVLNSQKKNDDEFKAIYKTSEKMDCETKETGTCSDDSYKTKAECQANAATWTESQSSVGAGAAAGTQTTGGGGGAQATKFERATMGDMLFNLKLRRCADSSCSEY